MYENDYATNYIVHSGVKGMHWGERRYQNKDGSLTALGRWHYGLTGGGRDYITDKMSNASSIRSQQLSRSNKSSGLKGAVRAQKSYNYANAALKSYDNSKIVKVANKVGNVSRALKNKVDYDKDGDFNLDDIKKAAFRTKVNAGKAYYNARSKVRGLLDKDGNGKVDALEKLGKTASDVAKNVNKKAFRATVNVGKTYYKVKNGIKNVYGDATDAISDAYSKAKAYLKTKLDRNGDNSVNSSDLKAAGSEFVRNAKTNINSIASNIKSSTAYKWIESTIESITDIFKDDAKVAAKNMAKQENAEQEERRANEEAEEAARQAALEEKQEKNRNKTRNGRS